VFFQHYPASCVEVMNEWSLASDPRYLFTLFSVKSVPLPRIIIPHSLGLVLFCYNYYVTCINFDAM